MQFIRSSFSRTEIQTQTCKFAHNPENLHYQGNFAPAVTAAPVSLAPLSVAPAISAAALAPDFERLIELIRGGLL